MRLIAVPAAVLCALSTTPVVAQHTVRITATNYVFIAPDTVPAGLTTFEFRNTSTEGHEAILKRVPDGQSARRAIATLLDTEHNPDWVVPAGGPNVVDPGATARTMQYLAPGTYYWICVLTAPDGKSHAEKGMTRVMVVRKPGRNTKGVPPAREPAVQSEIVMDDFTFAFTHPIMRGKQWVKVKNVGKLPHEMVIFQLAPGKRLDDVKQWQKDKVGTQPYTRIGGLAAIPAGEHALVEFPGTPGNYVLRCRVADAASGKTHAQLGMQQEITIQ